SDLRRDLGLTMIFISHDLGVVRYIADRLALMYQGKIVETGPAEQGFNDPRADYTRSRLASTPRPAPEAEIPAMKALPLAALLLSTIALLLVLFRPALLSQREIDRRVDARIAARERELATAFAPHFRTMFTESETLPPGDEWSPETL